MNKEKETYYQWCLTILRNMKIRKRQIWLAQYIVGMLIAVIGSSVLAAYLTPLWLILTLPLGINLAVYAWWKMGTSDA